MLLSRYPMLYYNFAEEVEHFLSHGLFLSRWLPRNFCSYWETILRPHYVNLEAKRRDCQLRKFLSELERQGEVKGNLENRLDYMTPSDWHGLMFT